MSAVGTRPRGTLTRTNSSSSLSSELSMSLLRWCTVCEAEFTQLRRPHRCRRCLEPVCAPCSPARLPVPGAGSLELKRTCKLCVGDDAAAAPAVGAATSSRRPKAVGAAAAPSPRVARITKRRSASMGSAARAPVGILSKPVYVDSAGLNPTAEAATASSPGPTDKTARAAVEPEEVVGVSGTDGGGGGESGTPAASPVSAEKTRGTPEPKPPASGGSTPRSRFGILSRVASVVTAGLYPAAASSSPSPAGEAGDTAAAETEAVGVTGKDGGDGSESGIPTASSPGPADKAGDAVAVEPKAEASVDVAGGDGSESGMPTASLPGPGDKAGDTAAVEPKAEASVGNDGGSESGANAGTDDDEEDEFFLAADDVEAADGGGGATPPPRAGSPLGDDRAAAPPPPPLAPKGDDYGAGAAAGTPGAAGSPPAAAADELDTAGSSSVALPEESGAADAEGRGVSLRVPPTAPGSRSQAAEPTASEPLHEIFAPRENSGAYADAMEEEEEEEVEVEEEETLALGLRTAGGEGPAASAAVASEATEDCKPAGTGLAAAAAAIAEDAAENASTVTAPPADAVDGEPVTVGIAAEELGDAAVAGVNSPPPVDVDVRAPLADSDVVPLIGADLAVGVDDAPPADPTSAASVPDEASFKLGGGASGEYLLPVAVANAGVSGAADVASMGTIGAAAVVGLSGDEPHHVQVPSGGADASPAVADEPSVSVVGKTSPHGKTEALGDDDGAVAPPSLPGGVATSVGGDALPDSVVVSGEVSMLPEGNGATGSAPEGSTAEVVIPVSPGVDTESPDRPGSVSAAPDVSVSASPATVAAGLDATSGNSVAEAPAPGGGFAPEVSDDSAVPPASGVSRAGEGVELVGGTAVLPEDIAGGANDDHEPSADSTGQMAAIRDTPTTPSSVIEFSASDPAAAAADVPPGDASATMPPDMGDVEGGDAPPVAGVAAASSDAAAVGDDEVPRAGGAGDLSALHGSDDTQPPPPTEEIPVLPSVASSSPPGHDDAGEGQMPAHETGDASVPDTAAGGGGVVLLPDTAADSAEPPVDGGVPMTASSSGVPAGAESNDFGSTPDASSSATGTAPASVPGLPSDDAGVPPADVVVPTADNEIPPSVGGADGSSVAAAVAGSVVLEAPPSVAEVPFSGDTPPLSVSSPEKGVAGVFVGGGGGGDASVATAAGLDLGGAAAAVSGAVNDAVNDAVGTGQSNGQPDDIERQTPLVDAGLAATSDAPSSASKKGKKSKFGFRTPSFLKRSKSSISEVSASDASGGVPSSAGDTPLSSVSLETPSGGIHASTPSSSAQSVGGDPTTEGGASTDASAEANKPKRGLFGGLSLKKKSSSKGNGKPEVPEAASPDVLAVPDIGSSLPQAPDSAAEPISAVSVSVRDGGTGPLPEASGDLLVPGAEEAPTGEDVRAPNVDVDVPLSEASGELSLPGTSIGGDPPVTSGGVSVPEISASLPEESGDVAVPDFAVPGSTEDPTGVDVPVRSGDMSVLVPEASGDLSVPGTAEVSIGRGVPMPSGDASVAPDIGVSMPEASGDLAVPGTAEVSIGGEVPVPSSDISASLPETSGELSVPGSMEASISRDLPVPSGGVSVPDISASLPEESGDLAVPALAVPGTTDDPTGVVVPVLSGDMRASLPEASGDPSVPGTKEAPIGGDLPVTSSDISGDLSVPDTKEASIGGDVPVPSGYLSVPDMSASPPEGSGDVVVPDASASIPGVSGTTAAEPGADFAAVSGFRPSASPKVSGDLPVQDLTDSSPAGISGGVAAPDADLSVPKTSDDEQPSAAEVADPGISVVGEVSELDDGAPLAGDEAAAATGAAVTAGLSELENGEKLGLTSAVVEASGDPALAADDVPPVSAVVPAEPSAAGIAMGSIPTVVGGEAGRPSVAVEYEKIEEPEEGGSAEQEGGSPEVVARAPTFTGTSIAMGDIPAAGAGGVAVESPSAAAAFEEKKEEEPERGGPPEVVAQASVSTVGGNDGPPAYSEAAAAAASIDHTGESAVWASAARLEGTKGSAAGEGSADAVNQPVEEPTVLPPVEGLPEDGAKEEQKAAGVTTADGTPASAAVDIVAVPEAVDKVAVGGTADNVADNMAAADQAVVTGGGAVMVGALADEEVSMAAGKAGLERDDDSLASSRATAADGSEGGVSRPALSVDDPRSTAAAAAVVVVAHGDSPLPPTGAWGEGDADPATTPAAAGADVDPQPPVAAAAMVVPEVPEDALPPPAACVDDEVAPVKTIVTAVSGGSSSDSSSSADGMPLPAASLDGEGATAPEALSGSSSGSTDDLVMPAASVDEEGAGASVTNPVPTDGDFAVPPGAAGKEQQPLAVEEQSAVAAGLEGTQSSPVDDSCADNAAASAAVEVTRPARTTVDEEGGDSTPEISVERNGGEGAEQSAAAAVAAAAAAAAAVGSARLGYGAGEADVELNKSSSPIASPPQEMDGADGRGNDTATRTGVQEGTQESGQGAADRDPASPGLPTDYATGGHPTEESMPSPSANQVPSTPQVRADVVGGGIGGQAPALPSPSAGGTVREPVRRSGTAVPPDSARGAAAGAGEKDWLDELIEMFSDKCSTCVVDDAS
ncbi:unnamed protein product [Ectocarpus sp. 13 AM-2016]